MNIILDKQPKIEQFNIHLDLITLKGRFAIAIILAKIAKICDSSNLHFSSFFRQNININ